MIIDSRGNPTVEADVFLEGDFMGRASVPSGASTGSKEAIELRDHDNERFQGKGVKSAVNNINGELASKIIGMDALDQEKIDQFMTQIPENWQLQANSDPDAKYMGQHLSVLPVAEDVAYFEPYYLKDFVAEKSKKKFF